MGKPRLPDVEKQEMLDLPMLLLTLLLTALGLVMIYSSSFARALYESGDSAYYFKRQGIFALVGTAAMLAHQPGAPGIDPENGVPGAGGVDPVFDPRVCAGDRQGRKRRHPLGEPGHFVPAL